MRRIRFIVFILCATALAAAFVHSWKVITSGTGEDDAVGLHTRLVCLLVLVIFTAIEACTHQTRETGPSYSPSRRAVDLQLRHGAGWLIVLSMMGGLGLALYFHRFVIAVAAILTIGPLWAWMETRAASASREYQARKRSFVTVFLVAAGIAAGWCGFSLLYGDAPWALPVTLFFSVFLFLWPLIARVLMELVFAHGLQPARAGDAAEKRHSA